MIEQAKRIQLAFRDTDERFAKRIGLNYHTWQKIRQGVNLPSYKSMEIIRKFIESHKEPKGARV